MSQPQQPPGYILQSGFDPVYSGTGAQNTNITWTVAPHAYSTYSSAQSVLTLAQSEN